MTIDFDRLVYEVRDQNLEPERTDDIITIFRNCSTVLVVRPVFHEWMLNLRWDLMDMDIQFVKSRNVPHLGEYKRTIVLGSDDFKLESQPLDIRNVEVVADVLGLEPVKAKRTNLEVPWVGIHERDALHIFLSTLDWNLRGPDFRRSLEEIYESTYLRP